MFFYMTHIVFRSLLGMCLRQIGIDCCITLEKSSFSAPSMPKISRFILRLIFELPNFSHLLSFRLFVTSTTICAMGPSPISSFSYHHSFIRLHSTTSKALKILLLRRFCLLSPLRRSAGSSFILPVDGCQCTFKKNRLSTSSSSDL